MRVVLAAAGSRGDVVPFGALAARLVARGHEVVVVTHAGLVEALPAGVHAVEVDSDPGALLAGPAGDALRRASLRRLNDSRHHFADFLHAFAAPTRAALAGADVLVASTFGVAAVDEATRLGVPVVRAHLWPELPGVDGPMPLLPYAWLLPRAPRRWARRGFRRLEPFLGGVDGHWEGPRLRLEVRHPVGLSTATLGTLLAYSPALLDVPGPDVRVTGWWQPEQDQSLSTFARAALEEPHPWLYVGFGSMRVEDPDALAAVVEEAAERVGLRPVLQLPGLEQGVAERSVRIGPEPHERLFPLMRVAVHHGGSGTTGAAVRAGVPSVVVPHVADQFTWGHLLSRRGVAPAILPRRILTARRLARRVHQAMAPQMRERAQALADRVALEDGTGAAVEHLERLVPGTTPRR